MPESLAWAIFFFPMASFIGIGFVVRPFFDKYKRFSGYLTILAVSASLILSIWAIFATTSDDSQLSWESHHWLTIGNLEIRIGILMDSLTAVMLVVVCLVSLMVQIYSQGYMEGDPGYSRYYAIMSLFTASMIGVVMASSIVQVFVFWELVGVSSYLLIGFWYHRPAAARAAMKAFLVTRLGDLGFMVAILLLFLHQGVFASEGLNPLEITDIHTVALSGLLGGSILTWIGLGIFAGAAGKSAQFPLHIWLPDAMEGPTPVSALIHAATMVAAGVFLVARFFPVFEASPVLMDIVAIVGAFTAIFAASIALVLNDIKRVVAYSTISQLGYMMLALGIGAYPVAIFHLFTHAFFKALLFLGSGSVQHASGTFNMQFMGGLRRYQPWTYGTFLIAGLSLAGIFPLAGFWSKDEILAEAFSNRDVISLLVFSLALITVFLTSFYIFRVIFLTFHGEFRGGIDVEHENGETSSAHSNKQGEIAPNETSPTGVHLVESPLVMVIPMLLLGVLAAVAGFLANPPVDFLGIPAHWITHYLTPPGGYFQSPSINLGLILVSSTVAVSGITLSWLFHRGVITVPKSNVLWKITTLLENKYYIDHLYEGLVANRLFYQMSCRILNWFDRAIVDEVVEKLGWIGRNTGRAISLLQTGQLQSYATGITVGVLIIFLAIYLRG